MKKNVLILWLVLCVTIVYGQNSKLKVEQLLITNKTTGESVKLYTNEETLNKFGAVQDVIVYDEYSQLGDFYKEYQFDGTTFYISENGSIISFEIVSNKISVEKKGVFSITIGDKLDAIKTIFPEEAKQAFLTEFGQDSKEYLSVKIPLYDMNQFLHEYVELDSALELLFDPDCETLKVIYLWIRP